MIMTLTWKKLPNIARNLEIDVLGEPAPDHWKIRIYDLPHIRVEENKTHHDIPMKVQKEIAVVVNNNLQCKYLIFSLITSLRASSPVCIWLHFEHTILIKVSKINKSCRTRSVETQICKKLEMTQHLQTRPCPKSETTISKPPHMRVSSAHKLNSPTTWVLSWNIEQCTSKF